MKLEKNRIFILQFDIENPRPNSKLFFQDANFLPVALTIKVSTSFRKRNQKRWWQVQQIINNSGFVSIKFNLIIFF